jgi:uncharacterized membrane protein
MKRSSSAVVGGLCLILATAGMVEQGAFRWVLFSIAGTVAVALAIRAYKND